MKVSWKWIGSIALLSIMLVVFWAVRSDRPGDEVAIGVEPAAPAVSDDLPEDDIVVAEPVVDIPEPPPVVEEPPVLPVDALVAPPVDDDLPATPPELTMPEFVTAAGQPVMPSPLDDRIRQLALEISVSSGPEAVEYAMGLLHSDRPDVGLIGVALLLDTPEWDEEIMAAVGQHRDPSVSLYAWQGLRDTGRWSEAQALEGSVRERFRGVDDWSGFWDAHQMPGTAVRGLVELSREWADKELRLGVMESILESEQMDYSGRMRALLEYRELMHFEDYRSVVYTEMARAASGAQDQVWSLGVERLAERLEGPVPVQMEPAVVSPPDVDLMVAREYPAMYEDLALRLEQSVNAETRRFGVGLTERLTELITNARKFPLSPSEQDALRRIETFMNEIEEDDLVDLPWAQPPI